MKLYMINLSKNLGNGQLRYIVNNLTNFSGRKTTNVLTFPIPMTDEDDTLILKLDGALLEISVDWEIYDEDIDLSEGTNTVPIKKLWEQVNYLRSNFDTPNPEDEIQIISEDGSFDELGYMKKLEIKFEAGRKNVARCTMEMTVGLSLGNYNRLNFGVPSSDEGLFISSEASYP